MKTLGKLFLFLLIALSINIYSQERINYNVDKFIQSSDTIKKAKGWSFDKRKGQWLEEENSISSFYRTTDQSFINIHTKSVSIDTSIYYVIIVSKYDGYFKYPSIKQDWIVTVDYQAYIFNVIEYNKLKSTDTLVVLNTKLSVIFNSRTSERELINLIKIQLTEKTNLSDDYRFPVKSTVVNGEKFKRFYLPSKRKSNMICWRCRHELLYENGELIDPTNINSSIKYVRKHPEYCSLNSITYKHELDNSYYDYMSMGSAKYDFRFGYFELPSNEFSKILIK